MNESGGSFSKITNTEYTGGQSVKHKIKDLLRGPLCPLCFEICRLSKKHPPRVPRRVNERIQGDQSSNALHKFLLK